MSFERITEDLFLDLHMSSIAFTDNINTVTEGIVRTFLFTTRSNFEIYSLHTD